MNATDFNQLKWLCVLQLIHDVHFFPGGQSSCWDEKNGLKFVFPVPLSLMHRKKDQTCFKLQSLSVTSARLFTKTKNWPLCYFRKMRSILILFPPCVNPKNWVYCRNEWLFKEYWYFLCYACQLLQGRIHAGHLCVTCNRGSGTSTSPALLHLECRRKMEHWDRGNWLREIRCDSRSSRRWYKCQAPKKSGNTNFTWDLKMIV